MRCEWCEDGGIMQEYHDKEWGVPLHNDRKQFEYLVLEVMQCGLNWRMMLKKREIFRQCFEDFDYNKIALYEDTDIERILMTKNMIQSRRKVEAVIHNAKVFLEIEKQYGSFDHYLWGFSNYKSILYCDHNDRGMPVKNALSDQISFDLKKKGFKYIGSITVYSHLQACGIINDHVCDCYRYQELLHAYPTEWIQGE